ncbi:hypothetical protein GEMRC1_003015 [Eukaryota sp. GEM-RC1]
MKKTERARIATVLAQWLPRRVQPDVIHKRLCREAGLSESEDPYLIPTQLAFIAALQSRLKQEQYLRYLREYEDGELNLLDREYRALQEAVLATNASMERLSEDLQAEATSAWFLSEEYQRLENQMKQKRMSNQEFEDRIRSLATAAQSLQEEVFEVKEKESLLRTAQADSEKAEHLRVEIAQLKAMKQEGAGIR